MGILWKDEVDSIREHLEQGATLKKLGSIYGVSKQRIYQVLDKYGLETPLRKRKNYLKGMEPKYYWLNRILVTKKVTKAERLFILQNLEVPDECPIFGVVLNYDGTGEEGFSRLDNSPSVDQITAGGGYTIDNIAIMSWRANRIKSDGTADEHTKIGEWIVKALK